MDPRRALDLSLGSLMLVVSVPVLAGVALFMRLSGDRGSFLYRARRVGEGGRLFSILKIRTMTDGSVGASLTARDDPRVTHLGRLLRRYRIDELPQLVNVLRGEMSLVGPRPEDPAFVDMRDPLHRRVLMARPGITGPTQLAYRDEADLLAGPDPEWTYRTVVLPAKLRLDVEYLERRSVWSDMRILGRTACAITRGSRQPAGQPMLRRES